MIVVKDAYRVLLVDDDRQLREMLASYLRSSALEVVEAATAEDALDRFRRVDPDLVVLDVGLPGADGFEVLRAIRAKSSTPVIMLTARSEEADRVLGLTMGADDYMSKPFSPRELLARISAVMRRTRLGAGPDEEVLEFDELRIDLARREILVAGRGVELSQLEFDLLTALASAPGRVFTRSQLLERVWGWDYFGVDRVVDVHIGNIRKALGDDAGDPSIIATVRGVGYKFVATLT